MRIRSFRLTDLLRVMQIERVSFGEVSSGAATFLTHVLRDRKHSIVAEDEQGAIVGYALVRMNLGWLGARRGGITSIAVDPPRRRRGTGRALMAYALEHLAEHGVKEADLEVDANNRAAQSLYEASGFRRSRLLPHYYGPNRDGIRMVLDLTGPQGLRAGRVAK
jgi:ribosomal-protein-alanine N-acetyltransferase